MPPGRTITKVKRPVSSPFIRLPIELVNIIFALAAEASRHTCLDLCKVASWARQIALPHLFGTLVAGDHGTKFQKYLANPPYIPFNTNITAASLVKNVWIPLEDRGTTDSVLDVFQNCHNITHMALTVHCFYKLVRSTTSEVLAPSHRKISGPCLNDNRSLHFTLLGTASFNWVLRELHHADVSLRSPLYDQITHVRVETIDGYKTRHKLYHFSRLSHLSVPYYNSAHHVAKQLDDFLKLRLLDMFVVAGVRKPLQQAHWKRLQDWVRAKRKKEKRVFFVEIPAMDIQAEWEAEMRGGESIWDRALRYTSQWEAKEQAEELVRTSVSRLNGNLTDSACYHPQEVQATTRRGGMPRRSCRLAA